VIGPNGSGKSTLLEILAGRVTPDTGDVAVRKGTRLSCVSQISDFAAGDTVLSVVERALQNAAVPQSERAGRIAETLGRVGFTDRDVPATTLSGGWRKRLAIAESLVQQTQEEQMLREAMGVLAPKCRRLIELLFFETPSRPYSEVASELGLAVGSIGFTRQKCIDRLRRRLGELGLD